MAKKESSWNTKSKHEKAVKDNFKRKDKGNKGNRHFSEEENY